MIDQYVSQLDRILLQTLSAEHVEEIVTEARSHLVERAEELQAGGLDGATAEHQSIVEFGELATMASELAAGFPPKPPFDPSRVRFVPEVAVAVILALGGYCYSIYGGFRGMESAAQVIGPTTPMLIIPGMVGGLGRLKYRRLRPLSVQRRMADYGFIMSIAATVCLVYLQCSGRATLNGTYPLFYGFGGASAVLYCVMQAGNSDGRFFQFLRRTLRS